jgi:hypothetical protein
MELLCLELFVLRKNWCSLHQYPLDASFHQFLGPTINNDYVNLCIWMFLKLLKIVPHRKIPYLIKKWYETNFESANKEVH